MKRSEMIEILDAYFQEVCYQDYAPHVEGVLELLEKAGMEPPKVADPCQTHVINQQGFIIQTEDSTVFINRWEDET